MNVEKNTIIKAESILQITENDLKKYKLHLACLNPDKVHPLDVFVQGWDSWVGWNEWMPNKNDFNREYIFSLIDFYHEPNKWLFGGIFRVLERHLDKKRTGKGYKVELVDFHKELIGRLVINFYQYKGLRGRSFKLEKHYKDFTISEILKKSFDGINFPGYENIKIDFPELEAVFKHQKNDWKGALENVKGVYVIVDKSNGKKYVGSAYGDFGIWSRWSVYIGTGHGFNNELTKLISEKGIDYARKNFRFSLLEYRSMKTEDNIIINRESYWKEMLCTKLFGYNKN